MLDTQMANNLITRNNYLRISSMISAAMFKESLRLRASSIWENDPDDDSQYEAIILAIGLERNPPVLC